MTFIEPAYATALDWLLCDALGHIAAGPAATTTAAPAEDGAYYFRLTTRPIDQAPFEAARARLGDAVLRRQVSPARTGWSTRRRRTRSWPAPRSCTWPRSGAVLPEVLAAPRSWPRRASPPTWST